MEQAADLLGRAREDLRRLCAARDQGRDAAQRSLLFGQRRGRLDLDGRLLLGGHDPAGGYSGDRMSAAGS